MEISLEHIPETTMSNTFRLAFHSAAERCLLQYPDVTGLTFTTGSGATIADWTTRYLGTEPLDDFVLRPHDRISFDLYANVNADRQVHRWVIDLRAGIYDVQFVYRVERDADWYDFLAKRSRFAAVTPIWRGEVRSNSVTIEITDAGQTDAV